MTAPQESDGQLYYLLALYAALDRAVLDSGDPEIEATVERFLPGTTGDNKGWSENLAEFVGGLPSFDEALRGFEGDVSENAVELSAPEKSRLGYVLGAASHLPRYRDGNDDVLARLLSLTSEIGLNEDTGTPLYDFLTANFNQWQDWTPAANYAAGTARRWVDPLVATVPLCNAWLTTVDGYDCVVVDTTYDDPSAHIDKIKSVVDPLNWPKCAGYFFRDMQPLDPFVNADGWGRVLETVNPRPTTTTFELRTALRYLKSEQSPTNARLNYDLDDVEPFPGQGDGKVRVDRGYINMRSLTEGDPTSGVRLVTKKVVHIEGLWPVAQKIYVCAMGYGHGAVEMLLGDHTGIEPVPWEATPPTVLQTPVDSSAAQKAAPGAAGSEPKTAASLAMTMVADCAEEATKDGSNLLAKWGKGDLTFADMMAFSAKYGARMASDPWKYLQRLGELPSATTTRGRTMTNPMAALRALPDTANDTAGQVRAVVDVVARQLDEGTYGLDAMTKAAMSLADIGVRAAAAGLAFAISGPLCDAGSNDIPPSEYIVVPKQDRCARRISLLQQPFTRVGEPTQILPPTAFAFLPELLPAGVDRFRIQLRDTRYLGGTYSGVVRLTNHTGDANLKGYQDYGVIAAL